MVILVLGVAAVGGGLVLVLGQIGPGTGAFSAQMATVVLAPGASHSLGTTLPDKVAIIEYTDNASEPIQVTSGSASVPVSRSVFHNGVATFITVITAIGESPQPVALVNSQSAPLSVGYAIVQSDFGALADGGLLVLGGGIAVVVGIILVLVGALMRRKLPPGQQEAEGTQGVGAGPQLGSQSVSLGPASPGGATSTALW